VDPGGSRLPPAGRCPVMQQWHGTRETSSGKFGLRVIMDGSRNCPQPAGRQLTVQKRHSARDAGFRDAVKKDRWSNRDSRRIRPGINLQ
jgi:hypothetical protein